MNSNKTLRIAGVVRESITDGPGIRFTVFAQGCPHRCGGCHNPQTWDMSGGSTVTVESIIKRMKTDRLLRGITLSGGEPFCQADAMASLASLAREEGYDVIVYSGYTFEELLAMGEDNPDITALLEACDILIDGPFIKEQKSYNLRFRGSKNQRIIHLPNSLKSGKVILADV